MATIVRSGRASRCTLRVNRQGQVGVQVSLVDLVEDHHRGAFEEGVALEQAHQETLGDDQDAGAGTRPPFEAHLVADLAAQPPPLLLGHPPRRRPRRHPPRLDDDHPRRRRIEEREQRRRHPRRLAGTGRSTEDGGGMAVERREELRQDDVDRQGRALHERRF
jgi:hypothetical protein